MATPCMPRLKLAAVALLSMCTRVQGFSATSMAKGLCSPGDGKTLMRVSNCGSDSACKRPDCPRFAPTLTQKEKYEDPFVLFSRYLASVVLP